MTNWELQETIRNLTAEKVKTAKELNLMEKNTDVEVLFTVKMGKYLARAIRTQDNYVVEFSMFFMTRSDRSQIEETVAHEVAHVAAAQSGYFGHGKGWKEIAATLGSLATSVAVGYKPQQPCWMTV